jgi:maleate isomerase
MFGDRARIGLLIVHANTVMESEFNLLKPAGVSVHAARLPLKSITVEGLREAGKDLESTIATVSKIGASSFVLAATAATFFGGSDYDKSATELLQNAVGGTPVITAASAVLHALRASGAKRLAVGTAYSTELNDKLRAFLTDQGFEVVNIDGHDTTVIGKTGRLPPEFAYKVGRRAFVEGVDALYLAPAGMRTVTVIEPLEEDLGVPVITSGQASIWAALRAAGIGDRISGYGSLLSEMQWSGPVFSPKKS